MPTGQEKHGHGGHGVADKSQAPGERHGIFCPDRRESVNRAASFSIRSQNNRQIHHGKDEGRKHGIPRIADPPARPKPSDNQG